MKKMTCVLTTAMVTASAGSAGAAVIVDPATFSGPGAIDPAGVEELDANAVGATAPELLEAQPDFLVVQDFAGFAGGVGNSDFIAFTDGSLPDVRFTVAVNSSNAGFATSTAALQTSAGTSVYLGNGTLRYEIDFGAYDDSGTFDDGVNAVAAAGFTLIRQADPSAARTFTAEFRSDAGDILSTQTYTDVIGGESGDDVFFGYQALAGESIGRITLRLPSDGNTLGGNTALDDFGFTAVPEPGSVALLAGGLLAVAARRRRA